MISIHRGSLMIKPQQDYTSAWKTNDMSKKRKRWTKLKKVNRSWESLRRSWSVVLSKEFHAERKNEKREIYRFKIVNVSELWNVYKFKMVNFTLFRITERTCQRLNTNCGLARPLVFLRISSANPKLSATGNSALISKISDPSFKSSLRIFPSRLLMTLYTLPKTCMKIICFSVKWRI